MNTKKILLTLFIVVLITGLIILVIFFGSKTSEYITCSNLTGGSYNLNYYDGNQLLYSTSVCIACSPESYEDLLLPDKENATFEGWYYDKQLTKKVETSSTLDITPTEKYDKNNCISGYETVNLYAKWSNA